MKPACIVKPHPGGGLFSQINKVVTCRAHYPHVHVDWSQGSHYGDCWQDLFAETKFPTGEFDTIIDYPNYNLTLGPSGFRDVIGNDWRFFYHYFFEKLKVNPQLQRAADNFVSGNFENKDAIGMLIRSDEHARSMAAMGRPPPPLDDWANAFERARRPNSVLHLMCADQETLAWFKARFPVTHCPDLKKVADRKVERHANPQNSLDAQLVVKEVLILSACRALIHGESNLTVAALYINPEMESISMQ
jgi:hypothetical protein